MFFVYSSNITDASSVLKQVHPDTGISNRAMSILNSFVNGKEFKLSVIDDYNLILIHRHLRARRHRGFQVSCIQ